MLLHKTPNQPKFRQNRLKNAWDISTIKNLCSPKKWTSDMFFCHGQKRDYLTARNFHFPWLSRPIKIPPLTFSSFLWPVKILPKVASVIFQQHAKNYGIISYHWQETYLLNPAISVTSWSRCLTYSNKPHKAQLLRSNQHNLTSLITNVTANPTP